MPKFIPAPDVGAAITAPIPVASLPVVEFAGLTASQAAMAVSSRLADMIMDVLGNESYPVVELARRLDVDWTIVLAVLEDLVARGGVVDEIAAPGGADGVSGCGCRGSVCRRRCAGGTCFRSCVDRWRPFVDRIRAYDPP